MAWPAILISLLVLAVVIYILFYILGLFGIPPKFLVAAKMIIGLIAFIYALQILGFHTIGVY